MATAPFFSGVSWIGAILLLLLAGIEVDLTLIRKEARSGMYAALGAIIPSLAFGAFFGLVILRRPLPNAFFVGIVLSVTAVSVAAKIFFEREELRRTYAQVILAAGIASEVVAWPLVSIASALKSPFPLLAGARALLFVALFFVFMFTIGRWLTFWAMRRVADFTGVTQGQLSLALILTLGAAALTQSLGLHPLLGAFVFGVILGRAPRANRATSTLIGSLQTLTTSLFAPIFFVLAGMRVNIFALGSVGGVGLILLLFVGATAIKVTLAAIGALIGRLPSWQAALVGMGVNLKGGTDVIVAIIGVELGLLTTQTYTIYTIVALLTVVVSPAALTYLARKSAPTAEEQARMEHEVAERRAYAPQIERALALNAPDLAPASVAAVLHQIALAKQQQEQFFDITELTLSPDDQKTGVLKLPPATREGQSQADRVMSGEYAEMSQPLSRANALENVEVTQRTERAEVTPTALDYAKSHHLIVLGGLPQTRQRAFSFGAMQDAIIRQAPTDVLVVSDRQGKLVEQAARNILVPVIDLEYSLAAADLAAYVARGYGADLTLFNVTSADLEGLFWREQDQRRLRQLADAIVEKAAFRVRRLGGQVTTRIQIGQEPASAILREMARNSYDLIALGVYSRGSEHHLRLGPVAQKVLTKCQTPSLTLIARRTL